MTKRKSILVPITLFILLMSCSKSEDDLTVKYSVSGTISFVDPEWWIDEQDIKIGLFYNSNNAAYSVIINKPQSSQSIPFSFSDVDEGIYDLKVFVSENNNMKATLLNVPSVNVTQNSELGNSEVQLLSYSRIQEQVFNNCTMCHGGASGEPSAGLILLEGSSYEHLVNIQSENSDLLRVKKGDIDESFLIKVLEQDNINFDHSASASATKADIKLVKNWISNNALNE